MPLATARAVLVAAAVALVGAGVPSPSAAQESPTRFLAGIPQGQAHWRIEFLEGAPATAAKMGAIRLCRSARDNFRPERPDGKADARCQTKVLKDTASAAQVEVSCSGQKQMTVDMTRESDNTYLVAMTSFGADNARPMKMRYTYDGPCAEGSRNNAMAFDKSSPYCQKMAAEVAQMDPVKQCAGRPADQRASCEAAVRARMEQRKAMCQ